MKMLKMILRYFFIVEEMPEFPGGEMALRQFIANAIKYPVIAQENGIQGKVYVSFCRWERWDRFSGAKIIRGVDPSLDKEAIRVVNSLPRWKTRETARENQYGYHLVYPSVSYCNNFRVHDLR